jgi:hypothetical protein
MFEIGGKGALRPSRETFFPESLCHECLWAQFLTTRRSTFLYCRRLRSYPPQPVLQCGSFERRFDA